MKWVLLTLLIKREAKKAIEQKKKKQTVNFDVRSELARLNMTPKNTQDIPPKGNSENPKKFLNFG